MSLSNSRPVTSFRGLFPTSNSSSELQFEVEVDVDCQEVSPLATSSKRVRSYLTSSPRGSSSGGGSAVEALLHPLTSSPTLRFQQRAGGCPQYQSDLYSTNHQNQTSYGLLGSKTSSSDLVENESSRRRRRRRHYSVEESQDYEDFYMDESSNDSGFFFKANENSHSSGLPGIKSFIDDLSFAEEALTLVQDKVSCQSGIGAHSSLLCGHPAQGAHAQSEVERREQLALEQQLLAAISGGSSMGGSGAALNFPAGMLSLVAGHIMSEAEGEPYGLKGCVLNVQYEGQTDLHKIASLRSDPGTLPTFELTLTLRQGQQASSWGQRLVRRLSFSSLSQSVTTDPAADSHSHAKAAAAASSASTVISTSYKLVKKRVYRQGEVEDVSPMM